MKQPSLYGVQIYFIYKGWGIPLLHVKQIEQYAKKEKRAEFYWEKK